MFHAIRFPSLTQLVPYATVNVERSCAAADVMSSSSSMSLTIMMRRASRIKNLSSNGLIKRALLSGSDSFKV